MVDTISTLQVELLNDAMWLEGRSDDALVDGANLAAVGPELIQFGAVEALGERRFRLSRLLRGRRGTEWATGSHEAGEPFTLITRETLAAFEAPAGIEVQLLASGVGDIPDAASVSRAVDAEVLRPPSPVHLTALEAPDGSLVIAWVRRSRQGWTWADGVETPLGEEAETYRLTIAGPGFERKIETATPGHIYTAAERAVDGPGPLAVSVTQAGSFALSRPATLIVD